MAGKPGRSGAPKANLNSTRNGTRLTRLTLGEMPKAMRVQQSAVRKYRRALETLVIEAHGEIGPVDSHLIDEATTAEVHAAVCRMLLKTRIETMSVSDVTKCSEQILKSKGVRNRAIAQLHLDALPPNPWEALDVPSETEPTDSGESNHD